MKTTVERQWQRHDQSGILYQVAKRFITGTSNFMGFGYSRIEQRHGGVGLGMKPYEREEEATVQSNTRRRGRNRKPRWKPGYDEYSEYQEPGRYEMEEAQRQSQAYGDESWTQYQGGGVCEEAQRGATARAEEQSAMEMGYQWLETSPCCVYCGANGHWAAYCERRVAAEEAVIKSAETASGGTQTMAASSGRRENRAEESGQDCEAGAELDRGKKRVGSGRMFDLRDNWNEVTASIKKSGE